ncbi:MAG: hypothetical protein U0Q03_23965 [Acidimicrobiales bacterium]
MERREGRNRKKKIIAIALGTTLAAGGGAAWALWSANGTGAGRATALTAQSITATAVTGTASLYPGATDGDLYFTLTNPNPYPVLLTAMTPGTITTSNPACAITNVSVTGATGLSLNVAAGATSGTLSINNVVSMVASAPDACQGVSFTINMTLTGAQV